MLILILLTAIFLVSIEALINTLDLRQKEDYEFLSGNALGVGYFFWIFILGINIFCGKKYLSKNIFLNYGLLVYLLLYLFTPIGARIFQYFIILLLISFYKDYIIINRINKSIIIVIYAFASIINLEKYPFWTS